MKMQQKMAYALRKLSYLLGPRKSAVIPNNSPIVERLIETGIIPKLCAKFELTVSVNEPLRITSECFVTEAQFREIADALLENPEEAKRIAHAAVLKSQISGAKQIVDLI
jgi:hypothetical protein